MKRTFFVAVVLIAVLAVVWFAGPLLFRSEAVYTVDTEPDGRPALVLRLEQPGLFVDLLQADDFPLVQAVTFSPWPGARRRAAAFFRSPLDLTLIEGDGPYDLADLPLPVAGGSPAVRLPEGWRQAGHYAGRFILFQDGPVAVALPLGMASAPETADKVRRLYAAAEELFGRPPVREKLAVVAGPKPEDLGRAVAELWVPEFGYELRWLERGATQYYAVKLLDQTKLWSSVDRGKWEREFGPKKAYAIAIWLEASLRTDRMRKSSLSELLMKAQGARTEADLLAIVKQEASLAVYDHLDRMLKGREPLPVTPSGGRTGD
ncbi:MAG TPA: hypothetical protein VD969_11375 [Symbiobacteriaceae bacterium]|nr:hypothetical protein [Symbiobacteriaceae bacterium]